MISLLQVPFYHPNKPNNNVIMFAFRQGSDSDLAIEGEPSLTSAKGQVLKVGEVAAGLLLRILLPGLRQALYTEIR